MELDFYGSTRVPDSYSRQLDERVSATELTYGYQSSPPPADTGNFDQRAKESKKMYSPRKK